MVKKLFSIENSTFKISISDFGAELQSIYDKNKSLELLWQGNEKYWGRRAPVLFPIVGKLKNDTLKYQHNEYHLNQHGFARDCQFENIFSNDEQLEFRLRADDYTRKHYPFDFELIIAYYLIGNTLQIDYVIRNYNECELPFSIGGHPAFNWPMIPGVSKEQHSIEFECNELTHMHQLQGGLLKKEKFPSPVKNQTITLKDDLFEHDAIIFDSLKNRTIRYNAADQYAITMNFRDFPQLGLWTKPGAPFICLEPWYGYASPLEFDDDIRKKPGIILLPSNAEMQLRYQFKFGK